MNSQEQSIPLTAMSSSKSFGAIFCVIGAASIVNNALFCFLLYRKPTWLKKTHNILLLVLAAIDMMTGVFIFPTPLFDITKEPLLAGIAGYLYCYLVKNSYVIFVLSKTSILAVMLLAIERWFSVVKPFRYKFVFNKRRLFKYIVFTFVLSAVGQIHTCFQVEFKNSTCLFVENLYSEKGQQAFVLSYVAVTFVIPTLVTWVSFIHIWYRIKRTSSVSSSLQQARSQQKLLLRMCAITAAALTGCWLPSQTVYVLWHFGFEIPVMVQKVSLVLSMSNSILNPWIYFFSNKEYRKEFFSQFSTCMRDSRVSADIPMPEIVTQINQVQPAF